MAELRRASPRRRVDRMRFAIIAFSAAAAMVIPSFPALRAVRNENIRIPPDFDGWCCLMQIGSVVKLFLEARHTVPLEFKQREGLVSHDLCRDRFAEGIGEVAPE